MIDEAAWATYLGRFHADHAGITERLLSRSRSDGLDPYEWCAEPLGDRRGPIVDIASGSGPLAVHVPRWIGIDRSSDELTEAQRRDRGPLVRASALVLPLAPAVTDAVVCSMAMQVLQPMSVAIAEASRVMTPSGRLVLLLPSTSPLRLGEVVTYLRLELALRRRVGYPNDRALSAKQLASTAEENGLSITSDHRRAFRLPIGSELDVDEVVDSLYLPRIDDRALRRARRLLSRLIGRDLAIPLRRVVLDRHEECWS